MRMLRYDWLRHCDSVAMTLRRHRSSSQSALVLLFFQAHSCWAVHYRRAVEQEIVTTDPDETPLVYPQAMLFMVLKEDGRLHQADPEEPLELFGAGEAHAIALARERSLRPGSVQAWVLLINDTRPLQFAQSLGIDCVAVPVTMWTYVLRSNLSLR